MNFDDLVKNYGETSPAQIEEKNPFDDMVADSVENETATFNANIKKGTNILPDAQKEINELSTEFKFPPSFVERNIEMLRGERKKNKIKKVHHDNPSLGSWLDNAGKIALAQDDLDGLSQVDTMAGRFKFAKRDPGLGDIFMRGVETNRMNLSRGAGLAAMSFGVTDIDEQSKIVAEKYMAMQERKKADPEFARKFHADFQKESGELQKAWVGFLASATEAWDEMTLDALLKFHEKGAETMDELFDTIGTFTDNPKGLFQTTAESSLNTLAAIPFALGGAYVGGKTGGITGAVAGSVLPGVGTFMGAGAGAVMGTIGGAGAGLFMGTAALEYAMELEGVLIEKGVDMSDPKSIAAAFRNPEIIKEAKAAALRKGITTAAVESLFTIAGAKMLTSAPKGVMSKTIAGAKGAAVDILGEGAGEFAGQVAKEKSLEKASVGEAVLETASAALLLGGGGAFTYSAVTANNMRATLSKKVTEAAHQAKNLYDKTNEAKDFKKSLDILGEVAANTKLSERDKSQLANLITHSSENSEVFFQADEFEDHWKALNESVEEKADDLLPGGRAELQRSKETGAPLRVPLADYITKFSEEESFGQLSELARKDPASFNNKQAEAISANIPAMMKELAKEARTEMSKQRELVDARNLIKSDIENQAIAAGVAPKDAKKQGVLFSAGLNALGDVLGVDSFDLFKRRQVQIQAFEGEIAEQIGLFQIDARRKEVRQQQTPLPESFEVRRLTDRKRHSPSNDTQDIVKGKINRGLKGVQSVKNQHSGNTLHITEKSLDELSFKPLEAYKNAVKKRGERAKEAARANYGSTLGALTNLQDVAKNAIYVFDEESVKGDLRDFEVYFSVAKINGREHAIKMQVEKSTKDGKDFREIYTVQALKAITEGEGVTAPDLQKPEAARKRTPDVPPSDTITLSEFEGKINAVREDARKKGIFFQRDQRVKAEKDAIEKINQDSLGFYSRLENEVEKMDFKAIPPKDLINRINKLGLKKEELEYSGIIELLESTEGKISKEDVLTFIKDGGLQFQEVVVGEAVEIEVPQEKIDEAVEERIDEIMDEMDGRGAIELDPHFSEQVEDGDGYTVYGPLAEEGEVYTSKEEAEEAAMTYNDEHYRELRTDFWNEVDVDQIEENLRFEMEEDITPEPKYGQYTMPGGENYREILLTLPKAQVEGTYQSGHWDESNVLVHYRLNDRVDEEGNSILFIEEVQSDWHQEGRKKGYREEGVEVDPLLKEYIVDLEGRETSDKMLDILIERYDIPLTEENIFSKLEEEYTQQLQKAPSRVPQAPFKATDAWMELALKRILRMAAEQGYDKIAWTPGEVQSKRYDLSKQIREIEYIKRDDKYELSVMAMDVNQDPGILLLTEEQLEAHVGKEIALKIVNGEGKKYRGHEGRTLEGLDLKTEAKGMIDLYDKMIPRIVNKLAKKMDKKAKTEISEITTKELSEFEYRDIYSEEAQAEREKLLKQIKKKRDEHRPLAAKRAHERGNYKKERRQEIFKEERRLEDEFEDIVKTIDPELTTRDIDDLPPDAVEKNKRLTEINDQRAALREERDQINEEREELPIAKKAEKVRLEIVELNEQLDAIEPTETITQEKEDVLSLPITDKLRDKVTKGQPLFQKDDGRPRGAIDLSDQEKMVIMILEGANKSTMLHEMGHAFLEYIKIVDAEIDVAGAQNDKQRRFKQDMEALKAEFGIESLDQIVTEHHERFARLFEAYLMEGKAPSKELRSVFNTFKTWLINIYKNIMGIERASGVKLDLSTEMRELFNRMLATEEEIAEVSSEMGYSPEETADLFKALGITDEETRDRIFNAHEEAKSEAELILYREHLKQEKKKKTKEYKARKKAVKKEMTDIADGMQVFNAIDSIKSGKIAGQDILGYESIKFNTDMLKSMVTAEEFRQIPKGLYSASGVDPAITADILGYADAKILVNEIVSNPTKKQFIDLQTDAILKEEFPDYMSPTMQQEMKVDAIDAVHNKSREKALKMELDLMWKNSPAQVKAIIKKTMVRLPSTEQTKAQAKNFIDETKYRDVIPFNFQRSENKFRRAAGVELVKGNIEKAIRNKVKETFNHQLYKEASTTKDSVEKRIKKSKDRLRKTDKDLAKRGNVDLYKSAQAIMAKFGMLTEVQVGRLSKYMDQLRAYSPDSYAKVEGLTNSLVNLDPMSYKDMNVMELNEVLDVVEALQELAVTENTVEVQGRRVQKEAVIDELLEQISTRTERSITKLDSPMKKIRSTITGIHAAMTRMEHLINNLDDGKLMGPFRRLFWDRANDAQNNYEVKLIEKSDKLNNIIKTYFDGIQKDKEKIDLTKYFPGLEVEQQYLTKAELVMALVHSGNESNLKKLLLGRNWGFEDMDGSLNTKAYDGLISDLIDQGIITKDMTDGVQAIWDLFEEIKPEIQKTHKEVYGYFFAEIEAKPLKMPWGTYRGGYAPAVTDPLLVLAEAERQNEASTDAALNQFTFAQTHKGFTKERVEAYAKALSLDFKLIPSHIEKTVRFSQIEGALHDLNRIMNDERLSSAMFKVNRFWTKDVFKEWLARFATQRTNTPATVEGLRGVQHIGNFLRRNANMAIMMGNFRNTFENVSDFSALFALVPQKNVWHGLKTYWANRESTSKFVTDNSTYMKLRMEHQLFEIQDTYKELMVEEDKGVKGKYASTMRFATKHTYALQMAVQNVADAAGWVGAYDHAISQGQTHDQAVKSADSIIRRVMGDNRPIDLASIEAQGELAKILLTFYSFFLNKANLVFHAGKGNVAKVFWLGMIAPNILAGIFRRVASGFDEDRDEEYYDDALDIFLITPLQSVIASYPGGSTAFRLVEGQFTDQQFDDRLSVSPLVGMIEGVGGISRMLTRDEIRARDIRDSLNFLTTITGIPVSLVGRPVGFLIDMEQGKQRADNPIDFTRGLLTGRSGKK